jgi:AraC-like DNA-binding protein
VARTVRTYSLSERAARPDFAIHDERHDTRIGDAHRHEYFQIQLNLSGETVQHIGAVTRPMSRGSLSFVAPYRIHRVPHPAGSRFYVINFTQRFVRPELDIDPLDLEDLSLQRAPELAPFLFQEFTDFRLEAAELEGAIDMCKVMHVENEARRYCSLEVIRAQLLLLLAAVCRCHETQLVELESAQAQRRSRRDALSRVIRYVRENLAGRVTLPEAAAAAQLSPNYLAHMLRKETGKTFVDLVTERRMERARELLAHTGMRIGEIAQSVGFEDEAYFARRFRQCFDVTPSVYRTRHAATTSKSS